MQLRQHETPQERHRTNSRVSEFRPLDSHVHIIDDSTASLASGRRFLNISEREGRFILYSSFIKLRAMSLFSLSCRDFVSSFASFWRISSGFIFLVLHSVRSCFAAITAISVAHITVNVMALPAKSPSFNHTNRNVQKHQNQMNKYAKSPSQQRPIVV